MLLGVYSSASLAIAAGEAYGAAHGLRWSWVEVQEVALDAPGEWQRAAIWTLTEQEDAVASA